MLSSSGNGWWEGGISGPEAGDEYKFVVVNSGELTRPLVKGDGQQRGELHPDGPIRLA